jgi:hypothetical protein
LTIVAVARDSASTNEGLETRFRNGRPQNVFS